MIKHASGLTASQAKKLLAQYGFNEINSTGARSAGVIFWRQIKGNFIIYLLLSAMIISFAVGKGLTSYTIMGVILMVIGTSFVQEYKAEKAIEYLKKMIAQLSTVLRGGELVTVPSRELVPGDIISLRTGERVPADAVLMEATSLLVNEAFLTGESKEIVKSVGAADNVAEDRLLFAGSFVVNGKCLAQISHTGMNTKFGKIAKLISGVEKAMPLQEKINKIAKVMAIVGITVSLMSGLVMLMGGEINKELIVNALILVIALSVSAFPEGLPVVLTTTLSLGAYRMAQKNAIVNRMSIIETLGETTVICADKTGTITKGEMTVKKLLVADSSYEVSGAGYEASGEFVFKGKAVELKTEVVTKTLLKCAVLCNDAMIKRGEGDSYVISGMPTEASLLVMAAKAGVFKEDYALERLEELPFDSKRKMMSVLVEEAGEALVYAKGAPEIVLAKCEYILEAGGVVKLEAARRSAIIKQWEVLANQAYRTMVLAYKQAGENEKDLESDLIYLGLVAIEDSPREGVAEALAICRKAGISVKMITGDNLMTAISIAKQIGLATDKVVSGEDLDAWSDAELAVQVTAINIFARVKPEHKLRIVQALQANGEVVTMTGDGINDSPALKEAQIGVAMGINGTDVSRSVADLILKDDNFATIVAAIAEGRAIFNNIRKFTAYQLSCNYAGMTVIFAGVLMAPWLGWPVPVLLALHILFMNMVTDNLPAITLGFNKGSMDIMNEPPRKNAQVLTRGTVGALIVSALIMTTLALGTFYFSYNIWAQSAERARSLTLVALIVLQIAAAFSFRSFRQGVFSRSLVANKYLVGASMLSLLATLAIIYTPLNRVFETVALGAREWGLVLILVLVSVGLFDLLKVINNKWRWVKFD